MPNQIAKIIEAVQGSQDREAAAKLAATLTLSN
jgi:hypothetical protein